jgi:2,3-bisphosphoglycerate-independent phosphoglycerate mutase
LVAGTDLIKGLARLVGWEVIEVPGATGYLDTDYQAKGQAAVQALNKYNLVTVHIEAPDEAGHNGDAKAKLAALEAIDKHIVGPVLEELRKDKHWRILICPDHPTPVRLRTHVAKPVPFALAGENINGVLADNFTEANAQAADLHIEHGWELMEYFIKS